MDNDSHGNTPSQHYKNQCPSLPPVEPPGGQEQSDTHQGYPYDFSNDVAEYNSKVQFYLHTGWLEEC